MQVSILPWKKDDIPFITALEKECFTDAWTREQLINAFQRTDFYGLKLLIDGAIVGYLCATKLFEEAELLIIAVAEQYRGLGFGGNLMDEFLHAMKAGGVEKVFLEVRLSNLAAKTLHERRGFVPTRVREKYYADGESALEMVKTL